LRGAGGNSSGESQIGVRLRGATPIRGRRYKTTIILTKKKRKIRNDRKSYPGKEQLGRANQGERGESPYFSKVPLGKMISSGERFIVSLK